MYVGDVNYCKDIKLSILHLELLETKMQKLSTKYLCGTRYQININTTLSCTLIMLIVYANEADNLIYLLKSV